MNQGVSFAAIPLLFRMMRVDNSSKLDEAKVLIRAIVPVFASENVNLLIDSWYMRATLIL